MFSILSEYLLSSNFLLSAFNVITISTALFLFHKEKLFYQYCGCFFFFFSAQFYYLFSLFYFIPLSNVVNPLAFEFGVYLEHMMLCCNKAKWVCMGRICVVFRILQASNLWANLEPTNIICS